MWFVTQKEKTQLIFNLGTLQYMFEFVQKGLVYKCNCKLSGSRLFSFIIIAYTFHRRKELEIDLFFSKSFISRITTIQRPRSWKAEKSMGWWGTGLLSMKQLIWEVLNLQGQTATFFDKLLTIPPRLSQAIFLNSCSGSAFWLASKEDFRWWVSYFHAPSAWDPSVNMHLVKTTAICMKPTR